MPSTLEQGRLRVLRWFGCALPLGLPRLERSMYVGALELIVQQAFRIQLPVIEPRSVEVGLRAVMVQVQADFEIGRKRAQSSGVRIGYRKPALHRFWGHLSVGS